MIEKIISRAIDQNIQIECAEARIAGTHNLKGCSCGLRAKYEYWKDKINVIVYFNNEVYMIKIEGTDGYLHYPEMVSYSEPNALYLVTYHYEGHFEYELLEHSDFMHEGHEFLCSRCEVRIAYFDRIPQGRREKELYNEYVEHFLDCFT